MRLNKFLNEDKPGPIEIAYTDWRPKRPKKARKKFKSQRELERWLDKMEGDIEVDAYLNEAFQSSTGFKGDKPGSRGPVPPGSPIEGMSKAKAVKFIYNGTKKYWYNKIYKDEYWQGPHAIFKQFDEWKLNWQIDSSKYRKGEARMGTDPMTDVAKEWTFTIWLDDPRGKKLYGHLIASGAGSVTDPLEKYDLILVVG